MEFLKIDFSVSGHFCEREPERFEQLEAEPGVHGSGGGPHQPEVAEGAAAQGLLAPGRRLPVQMCSGQAYVWVNCWSQSYHY
jgi:hypothetical protein